MECERVGGWAADLSLFGGLAMERVGWFICMRTIGLIGFHQVRLYNMRDATRRSDANLQLLNTLARFFLMRPKSKA
jgi:hypothetical protein